MSNLNDLLTGDNSDTTKTLGNAIGTLADLSGGIGAITGAISFFEQQTDQTAEELQQLTADIENGFNFTDQDLRAGQLLSAYTNIINQYSIAKGILDTIKLLKDNPPSDISTIMTSLSKAVEALKPEVPIWTAVFYPQFYWTDANQYSVTMGDAGYGPQPPTSENPQSLDVFFYTYVLPNFLFVLYAFCVIGALLDKKFVSDFADTVIRPAIDTLKERHDKIVAGIALLAPEISTLGGGPWTGHDLMTYGENVALARGFIFPGITFPGMSTSPLPQPANIPAVNLEYGAVEKYSGCSSMGNYLLKFGQDIDPNSLDQSCFYKFQVRLLRKAKDVYAAVGLPSVWNTINSLKKIVGDLPLDRPNFGDWSFREIVKVSNYPTPPATPLPVHLSGIAAFLKLTKPLDTAQGTSQISFRELLTH